MEAKVKWMRGEEFTHPLFKALASDITRNTFSPKTNRGFFVTRARGNSISAKFIEKVSGNRKLTDPFGNTLELPYVTYEVLQFRLSLDFPQLEFVNSGRTTKKLFLYLTELSGASFGISPVHLDVNQFVQDIGAAWGGATIPAVDCSDVMITSEVAADVSFFGSGNVITTSQSFLKGRTHTLSRAKIEFKDHRYPKLEVFNSGTVRIQGNPDVSAIDELRGLVAKQGPA